MPKGSERRMNRDVLICSAVGILGALIFAKGRQPLRKLQRACIVMRAAGFMCCEYIEGAKARHYRWREMVERAEREA